MFSGSMGSLAMASGWGASTLLVAYIALFAGVGLGFVFVNLFVGRFLRPANPHLEKLEIYECGEPAIGSSFVQFDLRFYVVALVFIIFDVEVAFLFPWSAVFGKASHLADTQLTVAEVAAESDQVQLSAVAVSLYRELGVANPPTVTGNLSEATAAVRASARQLQLFAAATAAFFFVVLLIGFAYEWRTGALDWIRSTVNRNEMRVRDPSSKQGSSRPVPA